MDLDTRSDPGHSAVRRDKVCIASQVEGPAGVAVDTLSQRLPARSVTIEMAVLELQARALRRLGDEQDLDLAGVGFLRLELPLRADVPAQHDPVWWFVGEDSVQNGA